MSVHEERPGDSHETIRRNIGRYSVERCLGSGGFGTVYLASGPDSPMPVAIKVPKSSKFNDDLFAEADKLRDLKHPGIVHVKRVGMDGDGTPFLVMQYIEGKTLKEMIQEDEYIEWRRAVADRRTAGPTRSRDCQEHRPVRIQRGARAGELSSRAAQRLEGHLRHGARRARRAELGVGRWPARTGTDRTGP